MDPFQRHHALSYNCALLGAGRQMLVKKATAGGGIRMSMRGDQSLIVHRQPTTDRTSRTRRSIAPRSCSDGAWRTEMPSPIAIDHARRRWRLTEADMGVPDPAGLVSTRSTGLARRFSEMSTRVVVLPGDPFRTDLRSSGAMRRLSPMDYGASNK